MKARSRQARQTLRTRSAATKRTRVLVDLYRSLDAHRAVTVAYTGRDGRRSKRVIEPYDIRTTQNGHIQIHAMCRLRGEARSFDVDRIRAIACHRSSFVLERPEATTPAGKGIVVRSERQLIARELGRDYLPTRPIDRTTTALAA